jgi:uncharacterized CHY-type Zn-finger protein
MMVQSSEIVCQDRLFFSSFSQGTMSSQRPIVLGIALDAQTRCMHYKQPNDVIAIKMKCCDEYYACKDCHDALTGHVSAVWPRSEWNQLAVLCGVCGTELTIQQYMGCANQCPACSAQFNPGCRNHYHFYFENAESGI